ncbi:MAG: hypothetical protein DCC49_11745 [Acidobacteria bacterium]|nr:MAG: hypothetical protein DCC49_11745 [Acidobacteriota bacterium]
MEATTDTYGKPARILHGVSALLIIAMIPMGIVMTRVGDGGLKTGLYRAHVAIGLVVLLLTLVRVVWVFVGDRPGEPPEMPPWRRRLRLGIHIGIYSGIFVLAISGIGLLIGSGAGLNPFSLDPGVINRDLLPATTHWVVSKLFIVLLVFHVAGVISYHRSKGDVLSRMGIPLLRTREANLD